MASDRTKNTSTIVSLFSRCPGVCSSHDLSEAFGVAHSLVYRVVFLGPPEFQAFHVIFRSLLECERRDFHWRPQNKARCGGPLYVDYNEFPNYGGTSFEGRDYDSRKAPVLGSALWRVHERVCVMVVSVEHLALCVTENDGSVCAYASASYS